MPSFVRRFIAEEVGQDIVEYALLIACIVLVGVAGWNAIVAAVDVSYDRTDQGLWNLYMREPGS